MIYSFGNPTTFRGVLYKKNIHHAATIDDGNDVGELFSFLVNSIESQYRQE